VGIMTKNYIGLACTGHDNAIAIVNSSGDLVFAEAIERPLQNKRALNCPVDDPSTSRDVIARYCEPGAELVIARTWSDGSVDILAETSRHVAGYLSGLRYTLDFVAENIPRSGRYLATWGRAKNAGGAGAVRGFDHHLTHASAACLSSPFETAACAVLDGFGEGSSCLFYRYAGGRLDEIPGTPRGPMEMLSSLGTFYSYVCALCGFDAWKGEEWKVMGLAGYGNVHSECYELMSSILGVDGLRLVRPSGCELALGQLTLKAREQAFSRAEIAASGQAYFADVAVQLLINLHSAHPVENLVLGGGCALNSSLNGQLLKRTPFKQLYVFSAPADDGNAVGAALLAYYQDNPAAARATNARSPYLGTDISQEGLTRLKLYGGFRSAYDAGLDVSKRAAKLLSQGKIVGWMQGRAEFGPRALGNRSILADPRPAAMKDRLNASVKFREEFRPFAPSILHAYGEQYFIDYQESPYMERTLVFREEVRARVPAVVHVDGTGRLQSVTRAWNPRYYELIDEFRKLTGVPLVLNTSFNVMGKPIIHSVEDAAAVFATSGLDALIIDTYVVEKK
jgi:carbamoyltransferase